MIAKKSLLLHLFTLSLSLDLLNNLIENAREYLQTLWLLLFTALETIFA